MITGVLGYCLIDRLIVIIIFYQSYRRSCYNGTTVFKLSFVLSKSIKLRSGCILGIRREIPLSKSCVSTPLIAKGGSTHFQPGGCGPGLARGVGKF